jgi:hypothetical protein
MAKAYKSTPLREDSPPHTVQTGSGVLPPGYNSHDEPVGALRRVVLRKQPLRTSCRTTPFGINSRERERATGEREEPLQNTEGLCHCISVTHPCPAFITHERLQSRREPVTDSERTRPVTDFERSVTESERTCPVNGSLKIRYGP